MLKPLYGQKLYREGPKTKASKAPVPVIAMLAEKLDAYRKQCGSPESGWMFPNSVASFAFAESRERK